MMEPLVSGVVPNSLQGTIFFFHFDLREQEGTKQGLALQLIILYTGKYYTLILQINHHPTATDDHQHGTIVRPGDQHEIQVHQRHDPKALSTPIGHGSLEGSASNSNVPY
jgi:hypothetical protein